MLSDNSLGSLQLGTQRKIVIVYLLIDPLVFGDKALCKGNRLIDVIKLTVNSVLFT